MSFETIDFTVDGAIGTLTINRPKALNALNSQVLDEIYAVITELPSGLQALIITGAGRAFVAGADVRAMTEFDQSQALAFGKKGHRTFASLSTVEVPTIAAINGFALGGGLELAISCDLLYASDKAVLGLPEVGLGVIPGWGGTQRLSWLIGHQAAREMVFTGKRLDANEAKDLGLVRDVFPHDELLNEVTTIAHSITKNAPLAVKKAKDLMSFYRLEGLEAGLKAEQMAFADLFGTADQKEGMGAMLEGRKPTFQGK